jgi:hypothetical protein
MSLPHQHGEPMLTLTAFERKFLRMFRGFDADDQARMLALAQAIGAGRITETQGREAIRLGPTAIRELADHVVAATSTRSAA